MARAGHHGGEIVAHARGRASYALDRIELEIWWMAGDQRRTFPLDSYRRRILRAGRFACRGPAMKRVLAPASR